MDYYIYKNDQNIGPLPESEVVGKLRNRQFAPDDLGCRVGDLDWKELSFFFPLETAAPIAAAQSPVYQQPQQPVYQQQQQLVHRQSERVVHQPVVVYQPSPHSGGTSDVSRLMYFEANKKSTGTAYLLWFFLGGLGAHRFYLGRPGSAVAQIAIFWGSFVLMFIFIGFLTVWITPVWLIVDLFLIPQMVSEHNNKLLAQASSFR